MKRRSMRSPVIRILLAGLLGLSAPVRWADASPQPFVVVESRGAALKPGQKLAGDTRIDLKEGERIRLISIDGRSIELRGPRSGPILTASHGTTVDRGQALSALIKNRNARIGSAGVVRAGVTQSAVPNPWFIDISRSGPRCVLESGPPILWRPQPLNAGVTVVYPADRSWRADIGWSAGQDHLTMPELGPLDRPSTLIIEHEGQEFGLSLIIVPRTIDDDLMLAAWMLDRGCLAQANALIERMSGADPTERRQD